MAVHLCRWALRTRVAAVGITGSLKHLLHLSFGWWGIGRSVDPWQSFFGFIFFFKDISQAWLKEAKPVTSFFELPQIWQDWIWIHFSARLWLIQALIQASFPLKLKGPTVQIKQVAWPSSPWASNLSHFSFILATYPIELLDLIWALSWFHPRQQPTPHNHSLVLPPAGSEG